MESEVFTIIYGAELGKPYALPDTCGRNSVRSYEGAEGRGFDKSECWSVIDRIEVFAST